MDEFEEEMRKEVLSFVEDHPHWTFECETSAIYTGMHMVNVFMAYLSELKKELKDKSDDK